MAEHEAKIAGDRHTIVSRRYATRLALRDMFTRRGLEQKHAEKVKAYTGIDVHAQITGGAMLTFRVPGTPAVCLPAGAGLTLVWASDDGIYLVLDETAPKSRMIPQTPVERFDAVGKIKSPKEYYRGILGAVCLKAVRDGKDIDAAKEIAESFIKELAEEILDPAKCSEIDPSWSSTFIATEIAPEGFVKAIGDGWENYCSLIHEWDKICEIVRTRIATESSANRRIETDGE
jgi:hypothetical protein